MLSQCTRRPPRTNPDDGRGDLQTSFAATDADKCVAAKARLRRLSTNEKYPSYTQLYRTAADAQQLEEILEAIRAAPPEPAKQPKLPGIGRASLARIRALAATDGLLYDTSHEAFARTVRHVFAVHKRGIVVHIRAGVLAGYFPFSNIHYRNTLSREARLHAEGLFSDEDKQGWAPPDRWYTDACLVKQNSNWLCNTPDWYYAEYRYLVERMLRRHGCAVPDVDFVINTANFPLFMLGKQGHWTDPHADELPRGGNLKKGSREPSGPPGLVFSQWKTARHNDILIPSGYEIAMASKLVFLGTSSASTGCAIMFPELRDTTAFERKKPVVVWRGNASNCGADRESSCRLKVTSIVSPFVNARLSGHQSDLKVDRARNAFSRTSKADVQELSGEPLTREQMLAHQYVLVLGGTNHNSSLFYFLQFNSVVLFGGERGYVMWCSPALTPGVHYLPVGCEGDAGQLKAQLERVVEDGSNAIAARKAMVRRAKNFYKQYIDMDFFCDYLAHTLHKLCSTTLKPHATQKTV